MVSNSAMMAIASSAIIGFLLPILLGIFLRKRYRISIKPIIIGAITFIFFSQILEKLLHIFVISNNIFTNNIAFAAYGALAAGIFEEGGRYIFFNIFLKDKRQWEDGLAFGLGHGGIEAILLAGMAGIQKLVYASMINNGTFETLTQKLPSELGEQLKNSIMSATLTESLLIGFERVFAMTVQIAFTLLVLYAIRSRKKIYLLLAVILHAIMDVPAALYQLKMVNNVFVVEFIFFLMAIIAFIYIRKSKEIFEAKL